MRYIPNTDDDLQQMLQSIGVPDFEDLLKNIPASVRYLHELNVPPALPESELIDHVAGLAEKNQHFESVFAGAGAYDHYIPAVLGNLLSRPEFMTAYTPYQPEVSQGTLQSIYEFQSMISALTDLPVSNASMYDGASALAEAALLAVRLNGRKEVLIAGNVNPHYIETIKTYLSGAEIKPVIVPIQDGLVDYKHLRNHLSHQSAAFIMQNPNFLGLIENVAEIAGDVKQSGALFIMAYDPISLGILRSPGELGADIACAEGQPLGLPLAYGGPYVGLFSIRQDLVRKLPGRLAARTVDVDGRTGYVLTLQTREQHIKRERATSNICTNQQLCALAVTIYLALMGKTGIRRVAELCLANAHYAAERITQLPGYEMRFAAPFFREFVVQTPIAPKKIISRLARYNILAGVDLGNFKIGFKGCLMISVTEKQTRQQIDDLIYRLTMVK